MYSERSMSMHSLSSILVFCVPYSILIVILTVAAASVEQTRILSGLDILSVRGYNELIVVIFSRAETEGEIEYEEYL